MLISQNIKNFVSGISQQPPILRLPEQLAEQINGLSTEASGLQKRPPTVFINNLNDVSEAKKPLIHFVDRDETERYIMYFYNDTLRIFDLEGNTKEVVIEDDGDYLVTDNPREDLKVLTIADYTFIVNKTKTVEMTNTKSPDAFNTQGALVHIKSGQYGRTYSISVSGTTIASYETPDGSVASHTKNIDTHFIANQLYSQVVSKGYECELGDSWFSIKGIDNISSTDGFNNQAMIALTTTVQKFSLLPSTAPADFTVKVKNDPDSNTGEYYVRYNKEDKVWEECACPNIDIEINASTMPHVLIRNEDGIFVFNSAKWDKREIGDDNSNPLPSFVGFTINDVFFHKNRLGFLANESVILSESGNYYNFWMSTATDVLDTDTIDIAVTTTRINILRYAVPFNEELYCFSTHSQFVVRSDTTLSPKNTSLIEVTGFNSTPKCRPVASGKNLYFATERAEYSSIKEYYSVENVSEVKNAQDITTHCPSYIPNSVYHIEANTNENVIFIQTDGETNALYVYKYLFMNEQRVQSSWSKWVFDGEVLGVFFIASTMYLILSRNGKHCLEKINFTYDTLDLDNEPYRVYLDAKKFVSTAEYDSDTEETTIDLLTEYHVDAWENDIGVVDSHGIFTYIHKEDIHDGKVVLLGNRINDNVIIGIPYNFKITLSPIYVTTTDNNNSVHAVLNGRLQLRYIKINYSNTGYFKVSVKNNRNNKYTYEMTTRQLGNPDTKLGVLPNSTGIFKVPIQMLNTSCTIEINSEMPLPISLIGYMWEGTFVQKSKGV